MYADKQENIAVSCTIFIMDICFFRKKGVYWKGPLSYFSLFFMTALATTPASSLNQTPAYLRKLAGELMSALLFVAAREIGEIDILDMSVEEQ